MCFLENWKAALESHNLNPASVDLCVSPQDSWQLVTVSLEDASALCLSPYNPTLSTLQYLCSTKPPYILGRYTLCQRS